MLNNQIINHLEHFIVGQLLPEHLKQQYDNGAVGREGLESICSEIVRVSESYINRERNKVALLSEQKSAQAYALYYTPINAAKIIELLSSHFTNLDAINSVLDFGSGPGTSSLALQFLSPNNRQIDIVEPSSPMREVAGQLVGALSDCKTDIKATIRELENKKYDLIFLANVLNEIPTDSRLELIQGLFSRLSEHGSLLIIEPALRSTTRELMWLRDQIFKNIPEVSPVFPCTHRGPCQMLASESENWCHAQLSWDPPPLVHQIDHITGFNKHRIKYAPLILRRSTEQVSGARLVEDPVKRKYGAEIKICSQERYGTIQINKRKVSARAKLLITAAHYDLIPGDLLSEL